MENSNEEKAESLPLLDENLKEEIFLPKRENIRTADPTKRKMFFPRVSPSG